MMDIEPVDKRMVDGDEPGKAGHTVEDATQAALFARHASQLPVGAVEDVGQTEQQDGDDVHDESPRARIIEAATTEEDGTGSTDEHRKDGNGVGMNAELGKENGPIVTERAYYVQIKPVFRLNRFQRLIEFFVHFTMSFTIQSAKVLQTE